MNSDWLGKPYYSLNAYFQKNYGEKYYKIALNAGLSCPNRDGTLSRGGCIFCSAGGSGDFAQKTDAVSIREQLTTGLSLFGDKKIGSRYIAYFQAYTNTYGPISYLQDIFTSALKEPAVAGISIATRPDCLGNDVLSLLAHLTTAFPDKFIWVELGLQTIHEDTARFLNRGYSLPVFETAMAALQTLHIPVIVHVILGLPGETKDRMVETCAYLNNLKPFGIKLQLLHILKDTVLGHEYESGKLSGYSVLTLESYIDILIHCLEILSPEIVIHRLTGDGPRDLLIAPKWSLHKRNVLNTLHRTMKQRNTYQGRYYYDAGSADALQTDCTLHVRQSDLSADQGTDR